ncbi:tail-related protein [Alteromonas phage vB_AmeP_PT11-V19]|nr:tail-related protein [Alteromonas phage vB_AmeP_PT11-V19]
MSTDINLNNITNDTDPYGGTGIFDKLMLSMTNHIEDQFRKSRLTGADYAKVYLGIAQSVLSQSITYALQERKMELEADLIAEQIATEQKNNEADGVIDRQKEKLAEEIELVKKQIESQSESIAASKADTLRRDTLNAKEVEHRSKETELVVQQKSELELNGTVERELKNKQTDAIVADIDNNNKKTTSDVAYTDTQKNELLLNGETQRSLQAAQKDKVLSDIAMTDTQENEIKLNGESERSLRLKQIDKTQVDIALTESQRSELLLNGSSQRAVEESQVRKNEAEITYTETREEEMVKDGVSKRALEANSIEKQNAEISYVSRQESELLLNGDSKRALEDSAKEKNQEDVLLTRTQISELVDNGLVDRAIKNRQKEKVEAEILIAGLQSEQIPLDGQSNRDVNSAQISRYTAEATLLNSRNSETIAATARNDAESAQKVLLMQAQSTGFKTDAKLKLLKQLVENYAINVTTLGEVPSNAPVGANGPSIDAVADDLLDDLGSSVNVGSAE